MSTGPAAPRRIAVVGASAAGLSAVETLRREGFDGDLTLIGREEHLPYDRPPLSKQFLSGSRSAEETALRPPAHFGELGLDLRLGTAATALAPDRRTVTLADGTELGYDGLIIATGVRPRPLPGGGVAGGGVAGVHVLRTLEDAAALRDRLGAGGRLVVVGAGFLGTEVAAVARGLGVAVTVVEPAPIPLAHAVGEEAGAFLARLHREHGVELRTGTGVAGITAEGGRADGVRLTDGTRLPADDVLVAIGSRPNTEWLRGSGLRLDDGVLCDAFTAAAPGVHAAGDVARWPNPLFGTAMRIEHRTNAAEQAMAAARNLLHPERARPFAPVPYFWSDQYEMKLQAFGHLRGHQEARVVEGSPRDGAFLVAYRSGDRLTGVLGVGVPPKALRRWRTAVAERADWRSALADPQPV